jgi:hypothetical protein
LKGRIQGIGKFGERLKDRREREEFGRDDIVKGGESEKGAWSDLKVKISGRVVKD